MDPHIGKGKGSESASEKPMEEERRQDWSSLTRCATLGQRLLRSHRTPEFQENHGFVPDNPAIMTGRYIDDISRPGLPLCAVVELAGNVPR